MRTYPFPSHSPPAKRDHKNHANQTRSEPSQQTKTHATQKDTTAITERKKKKRKVPCQPKSRQSLPFPLMNAI